MAGYIMTLSNMESLQRCIEDGIYSTILASPKNGCWRTQQEGTFADYYSMKAGDSIYFFHKRKIYGIGKLVNIQFDCKFLNFKKADEPEEISREEYISRHPLLENAMENNRCFCTFVPSPYFFKQGVDMDDVLSSNPERFRIFRTMWQVSFIKIDDEEDKALQDIILKRNEDNLMNGQNYFLFDKKIHIEINNNLTESYRLSAYNLLLNVKDGEKVRHEMALEAFLCDILSKNNDTIFGNWDYISHQVSASPFKPINYMDKMDLFGYRYIPGFKTISKYLVIEIKKDSANEDVIDQVMKYVDWVNQEYAHGDYSMIEAYVVSADFSDNVIEKCKRQGIRNFTKGYRPTQPCTWDNVTLVKYCFEDEALRFYEIEKG